MRIQEEVKRLEKSAAEAEALYAKDPPIEKLFFSAKPGVATGMDLKKLSGVRNSSKHAATGKAKAGNSGSEAVEKAKEEAELRRFCACGRMFP